MNEFNTFLKQASAVRPSSKQTEWFNTEFYAFVHFSPNTYTGLEWGLGSEDPAIFNPTDLDCNQWVETIKSAGMKGMILTAKHHDGFCLWPSKYTEHCIKNSPYKGGKGDIVGEAAAACRRGRIKFGIYLSPWDRNCPLYGTDDYNDYYEAQLTELLTQYGELFAVWFDGACGEGPNGRHQVYDFDKYFELVRKYQPNAFINAGVDYQWIGNEGGRGRHSQWAVMPSELCPYAPVQTSPGPLAGDMSMIDCTDANVGSLSNIMYSKGLCFCGSEMDFSIRKGWFYHPEEEPHSLGKLFHAYLDSVGNNACLILNIPPMPNGLFDPRDVQRVKELGEKLQNSFGKTVSDGAVVTREPAPVGNTQCIYTITLPEVRKVAYVELSEDMEHYGQRIESFRIHRPDKDGLWQNWDALAEGTTVGHKRLLSICGSKPPFDTGRMVQQLRIVITAARDTVENLSIKLY